MLSTGLSVIFRPIGIEHSKNLIIIYIKVKKPNIKDTLTTKFYKKVAPYGTNQKKQGRERKIKD